MKALIVGYGSIGSRHARILSQLGCRVAIVSRRDIDFPQKYINLSEALDKEQPDYVIIANKTCEHHQTLLELAELNFSGIVLVEKPLFHFPAKLNFGTFKALYVAYNLRFHPIVQQINDILKSEKILTVQAYVGQYLPLWRQGSDYTTSYSAKKANGGGALRDLSHELDYLNWILGDWESIVAIGGHYSELEIDSDDVFTIMMNTQNCPVVSIQMNYLDRIAQRELIINTQNHTLKADLIRGYLQMDGIIKNYETDRDFTYRSMHQAILNEEYSALCTAEEGLSVLNMIDAAERSMDQKVWVNNEKTMYHLR